MTGPRPSVPLRAASKSRAREPMRGPVVDRHGGRKCQTIVGNNCGRPPSNATSGAQRRPNKIGYFVALPDFGKRMTMPCNRVSESSLARCFCARSRVVSGPT